MPQPVPTPIPTPSPTPMPQPVPVPVPAASFTPNDMNIMYCIPLSDAVSIVDPPKVGMLRINFRDKKICYMLPKSDHITINNKTQYIKININ
jgi:hypothetical protein